MPKKKTPSYKKLEKGVNEALEKALRDTVEQAKTSGSTTAVVMTRRITPEELAKPASEDMPRDPKTHELKSWPEHFQAVLEYTKRYERQEVNLYRDHEFLPGDTLFLREFEPCRECEGTGRVYKRQGGALSVENCTCDRSHGEYTGRELYTRVLYVGEPIVVAGREPYSYEDHVIMAIGEPRVPHKWQGTKCSACEAPFNEAEEHTSCPGRPRVDPRDEDDDGSS